MAKITINDQEFEVEEGKNLIDAAEENGIEIPHYCYHPGLSVAGQCRMCAVELEGARKIQIACNLKCKDGMKIKTNSPQIQEVVKANLEFHLINHPIDCPICDQAGECGLQDYYMKYGKYRSEMREEKVNKQKVVDLGDRIVLDKERCILCSRCVRFTQEISKTAALGIYNRGDRSVIGTVNDLPMTDNYQVNTVDICPVGALTLKDFRFEQRVWFLEETKTVCGGCSQGCNIFVHHKKGKQVYRLKPRHNPEINSYWMCDAGRDIYKNSNYDRRATAAALAGVELPLDEAVQIWTSDLKLLVATERMDEIGVWLAPHLTNEELESIYQCFQEGFQINKFFSFNVEQIAQQDGPVDGYLYRKDPYPNSAGFLKWMKKNKIRLALTENLLDQLKKGSISHLILFVPEGDHILPQVQDIYNVLPADIFVTLITAQQAAVESLPKALSIPTISHLEKNGHIENHKGIIQELSCPFKMFEESAPVEEILDKLTQEYRKPISMKSKAEV